MEPSSDIGFCERIKQIRVELLGARGKAAFARQLGISPTTYQSYESSRVPPAVVLVRIAVLGDVVLRWLLTGQSGQEPAVPAGHPIIQRAARLLAKHPGAAAPLNAFVEILAESLKFPAKEAISEEADGGAEQAGPSDQAGAVAAESNGNVQAEWIPILGRSAAGVPHFWSDRTESAGVTTLADLIERHAGRRDRSIRPATAHTEADGLADVVQIITLTAAESREVIEFISAPSFKARHRDAFAVRIDGQSMSPDIRHGDVVILSPSVPAASGWPAVIQLEGQIGVTCKLFRKDKQTVHLVPIHEQFGPKAYPAERLVWALRVLVCVRPAEPPPNQAISEAGRPPQ